VGEVVEVGPGVTNARVGDRVAPYCQVVCGMCENCRRGIPNKCLNLQGVIEGGFSAYGRVSATGFLHIPEELTYEEASFIEPLACCINGSWRSQIRMGDDVLVVGAGPIGLLHVQLGRLQGARVFSSDLIPERLALARELGAWDIVNVAEDDPVQRAREWTAGRGFSAVIVTAGSVSATEQAAQMLAVHGTLNVFAVPHGGPGFAVAYRELYMRELNVIGSNHFSPHTFQTALNLLSWGYVQVKPLISHRLPLEQTREGFDIVAERQGLKVLILPQA
jgi:L-iditol 2-dehydrogenase